MWKSFVFDLHAASAEPATRKAGHGNDRMWKAWKAMKPASYPSHTLWKSLRDYHITTAATAGYMFCRTLQPESSLPQGARNGCPGTLTLSEGLSTLICAPRLLLGRVGSSIWSLLESLTRKVRVSDKAKRRPRERLSSEQIILPWPLWSHAF
jgi:hypothetical protein